MTKQKLKLKARRPFNFEAIKAPFKNANNQKIFAAILILISLYLLIAFTDFFFQWKADDSLVSGKDLSDVITEKKITNSMGGLGAYISHLLIKLWFGIAAFFIPLFSLLAGLKILGFKKYSLSNFIFNGILGMLIIPVFIRHFFNSTIISGGIGIYTNDLINSAIGHLGTSLLLITISLLYLVISFDINTEKIQHFIKKIKPSPRPVQEKKIEKKPTPFENSSTATIEEKLINTLSDTNASLITPQVENTEASDKKNDLGLEVTETAEEEVLSKTEIEQKLKELGDFDPTLELSQYKMPPISLLNDYGGRKIEIDKDELENNKNRIVETLGHYNWNFIYLCYCWPNHYAL